MKEMSTQKEIIEDFKVLDGDLEMTLNYLMELGEKLDTFNEKDKKEENIVKGCQSKVWLTYKKSEDKLFFSGDSNTAITKGLLSLLIRIFSGKSCKEILDTKLSFIGDIGLNRFIGTQRSNGLESMENRFRIIALSNK
ncbi:MAG: Fe-S metabolism protein SufE [Flammeovirgaceae bacterium]|nr:Fe-S metabolism protein SufE [Flammeovirgaceae bacterium]|tara:strand:+ start:4044 stop:4457 length:414 start_codon:yes stop_codon:yes gene_type:complete